MISIYRKKSKIFHFNLHYHKLEIISFITHFSPFLTKRTLLIKKGVLCKYTKKDMENMNDEVVNVKIYANTPVCVICESTTRFVVKTGKIENKMENEERNTIKETTIL